MASRLTIASVLVICLVCAAGSQNSTSNDELVKWRAVTAKIQVVLSNSKKLCREETPRGVPVDAAEFAGSSFALVDVCPAGASTESFAVMRLQGTEPVVARLLKDGREIPGLLSGSSAMHGNGVKLVAEKLAIYDISWSNDGLDEAGIIKLRECKVEAYVWNSNDATFDFNRKLSREATRSYCRQLQHEAH